MAQVYRRFTVRRVAGRVAYAALVLIAAAVIFDMIAMRDALSSTVAVILLVLLIVAWWGGDR